MLQTRGVNMTAVLRISDRKLWLFHGPAAGLSPHTEEVDRERAEAHLRLLAEAELRASALHPGGSARVERAARVLTAVGALDDEVATQILDDFELAFGSRDTGPARQARLAERQAPRWPAAYAPRPPTAEGPVVPLGQLVPVRARAASGEIFLLSYAQPASRGLFTMIARTRPGEPRPEEALSFLDFSATDDKGNGYGMGLHGSGVSGPGEWILRLHPDPPRGLLWLDLRTAAAEPAVRVGLDPRTAAGQLPDAAEVTVSSAETSPGEHMLNTIAMRLLATAAAYPQHMSLYVAGLRLGLAVDGLGDVITALQAAEAVSPRSPLPAQLAALCARLVITGHGITTPPANRLPERWDSVYLQVLRGKRAAGAARSAAAAVALPEVDGVRLAVLGLHDSGDRTVLFMHASGATGGGSFELNTWPVIWIRDSGGWWHATSVGGSADEDGEITMDVVVAPPLGQDTDWIEVVAGWQSAEVRARLPLPWR